jgi:hypothetical protein
VSHPLVSYSLYLPRYTLYIVFPIRLGGTPSSLQITINFPLPD